MGKLKIGQIYNYVAGGTICEIVELKKTRVTLRYFKFHYLDQMYKREFIEKLIDEKNFVLTNVYKINEQFSQWLLN